ncbi:MAG: LacI family DNA-binding transcriptional regulator [Rhizobium sp.]|nr:LacI family DNA-binding transcriptional regulator [Rhizobium sp.]
MTSDAIGAKPKAKSRRASGRPTLSDVADLAGVGSITVSRALRDPSRVSPELRERIDAAVKALGYVLNPNARALASVRSDVIGVLIPSMTNNVFSDVVRGIHDGLGGSPLQVQFGNTHYSAEEEERLLGVFLSQHPSALIVSGIDQSPGARRLLDSAGCPVVQIMEVGEDPVDMMIGFSHFDGGRAVTRHMLESGRRRIAFLGARMDPRSTRRLAGYAEAMTEAGLADDRLVTTTRKPSSVTNGDARRLACGRDQPVVGEPGFRHRLGIAGKPPGRPRVHPRTEKGDAPPSALQHMPRHRPAAVEMREADHHVDRVFAHFHDLHDRAAGTVQQAPCPGRLVDAGDDQRRRMLAEKHAEQSLLLLGGVVRIAELNLQRRSAETIMDPANHVRKDIVGHGRDQDADDVGAHRGQRPCIGVEHIAERLDRGIDTLPQFRRDARRVAQCPRDGDRADAGKVGHVGQGRTAACPPRFRLRFRPDCIRCHRPACHACPASSERMTS